MKQYRIISGIESLKPEIKEQIKRTDVYQRFVKEQKKADRLATQWLAQGGRLCDKQVYVEFSRFCRLAGDLDLELVKHK